MSEYIGSRISLISNSDIRYVGTLKAIDSNTATVSLENVTCNGTEDRVSDPDKKFPGSDVVYEGIVFRGSDVKDLTILAPPKENKPPQMPNDPAILGSAQPAAAPPQSQPQPRQPPPPNNQYRNPPPFQPVPFGYPPGQFQQPPRFQGPGGPHGFPGTPGAVPNYGMGYGGPPPPGYGMGMGYGPPPGQGFPQHPQSPFPPHQQMPIGTPGAQLNQQVPPPPPLQQQQSQPPIGSKQSTPQPAANQTSQPPTQPPKPAESSTTQAIAAAAAATSAPPPPLESKPPASVAAAPSTAQLPPAVPKASHRANNRVAVPLAASNADPNKARTKPPAARQVPPGAAVTLPQAAATMTDAATAAVAAAMANVGITTTQGQTAVDNLTQKVNQMKVQDAQTRGRGRGRGGAARGGGRRESAQKTVEVPKEDFDFESANAKFNKHELAKEAIATGSPVPGINGTASSSAEPAAAQTAAHSTNGHLSGGADEADDVVIIPAKPTAEPGYDKKSSFFDNISSDLKDRGAQHRGGEQIDGRNMRREERSKNMETFGQGSVDGGFRGRGRGRGRGGFGRGGGGGGGAGGGRGYFGGRGRGFGGGVPSHGRGRGRGGSEQATS